MPGTAADRDVQRNTIDSAAVLLNNTTSTTAFVAVVNVEFGLPRGAANWDGSVAQGC